MGVHRRVVLGTMAAAGALVVGWSALPPRQRLVPGRPLAGRAGERALNGWVRIGRDERVTVVVPKSEMGQGVHTALTMLLAEELDADFAQVAVEQAPIDAIYNNQAGVVDGLPFHPDDTGPLRSLAGWLTAKSMREFGLMVTGGSSSVKDLWLPLREAGASARAMLVAAAAGRWNVPAGEIQVAAGRLTHPASSRAVSFGEVAAAAAALPLPEEVALKDPSRFRLVGRDTLRIEAAVKVGARVGAGAGAIEGAGGSAGGSADGGSSGGADGGNGGRFGIDVLLPGLLYATVRMCPTLGGKVASLAGAKAMSLPGVKSVFAIDGQYGGTAGVAVIADTPWHALKAIAAVQVTWDEAVPAAALDSAAAIARLHRTLDTERGFAWFSRGDAEGALAGAARTVQADYAAPWLAHETMEPMNCTVQFKDGRATVWAGTQVPDLARMAAARALGLHDADKVQVHVQWLGGGFGRRLDVDFIAQAAAIARNAPGGAPVQTFWSRAEDTTHDFYRPACVSRWRAGFDADGRLLAVDNVSAGQALVPQVVRRLFAVPVPAFDKTASEGAFDQPYEWPAARIAHAVVPLPVPVGFWRSVGHSHQAFFKESFVDEMAAAVRADPVAFRLGLLKEHPRHARVLQLAAGQAGWGTPPAPAADGARVARGVALHESFGTVVAQVAEVSLAPATSGAVPSLRVHRVVCAVDCGLPVNPNHVRQQMESGIVFGLSAALFGGVEITKGRVTQTNFHDQPILRLSACPLIETHIVPSTAHPEGIGEPGTPPIAPAVANAVFALTGERLRTLPLKPTRGAGPPP
ncbi:MAG: xanthine dehydrogenase family protein molybdopterin-binding subunit [Rubrivivax sp.]|nr:xanthine dehydrogenase family protein molybdopterin-binding subunit [Rubrivivax sp.]